MYKSAVNRMIAIGFKARILGSDEQIKVLQTTLESFHDEEFIKVGTLKTMLERSRQLYEIEMLKKMGDL